MYERLLPLESTDDKVQLAEATVVSDHERGPFKWTQRCPMPCPASRLKANAFVRKRARSSWTRTAPFPEARR